VYQTFYTFLTTGSYCAPLMSSTASITVNVTDPNCEFEIGVYIPPPYPPTPPVTPSATPGITVTPSVSISPTISISPSKTPSVTPTATISVTPSLTPTPSPSTAYEFRSAKGCCDGADEIISIPTAFGAGFYSATNGRCYSIQADPIFGPATIIWNGGLYVDCAACQFSYPCPSPTPTPTISISTTPTPTISISATPSVTPTISISRTPTATPTISISATPSVTPTISISRTPTVTPTISISATPSVTPTISISATPSLTPTLTPTLSVTPSPTATFPACAIALNSVTYVGGTNWSWNFTKGTSCFDIDLESSNDGVNWNNTTVGCNFDFAVASIGGLSGTLYFRLTMYCNLGGPAVSNVIIVNNVSATPTPTISLTPTPTPTISISRTPSISISATPSVTPTRTLSPSITPSRTPTVTPSSSSPFGTPVGLYWGITAFAACNAANFGDFCLNIASGGDLCTSTAVYDSDIISCLGTKPSARYFSAGSNVRQWNGTNWLGACVTCP
jgi:hypothetical protein